MKKFLKGFKKFFVVMKLLLDGVVSYIMSRSTKNEHEQETQRNPDGVYTPISGKTKRKNKITRFLIKTALIIGLIVIAFLAVVLVFNAIMVAVTLLLIGSALWAGYLIFRDL